jgi:hypothetical protein
VRKRKPYAGQNGEQVESTHNGLNHLACGADDELREITQRNVEYRPVGSVKQPKFKRGALVATGTLVALSMTACSFAILLKKVEFYAQSKFKLDTWIEPEIQHFILKCVVCRRHLDSFARILLRAAQSNRDAARET